MSGRAPRAARVWMLLLLASCARPPVSQVLTVRDPDKLCRWIVFSGCGMREQESPDAGE